LLADARAPEPHLDRLLIRDRSDVHVVPVETIDYFEARDDYVAVRAGAKTYLKLERLATLMDRLDPQLFVRVHRSFIVNIDRLSRIELYARDSRILFLRDGTKIPLSRAGYRKLKGLL
jgi:two-component system LytT family response regulator